MSIANIILVTMGAPLAALHVLLALVQALLRLVAWLYRPRLRAVDNSTVVKRRAA
jgi:predicted membrane-bound mannosyltransferase